MKHYTGVGSRETPQGILSIMRKVATILKTQGYTLRSGGAVGADSAFEQGAGNDKEIFYASDANAAAMEIAASLHPNWNACNTYAKQLHARNAFQVLGRDLKSPSSFLICWTQDGCQTHKHRTRSTGGTGTAISIADKYGVPIFNIKNQLVEERLIRFINLNI